jgi:hypothetical protein
MNRGADADLAGQRQVAAMHSGHGARERQTETDAVGLPRQMVLDLPEGLEDAVEIRGGDAASGVADDHDETALPCGRGDD